MLNIHRPSEMESRFYMTNPSAPHLNSAQPQINLRVLLQIIKRQRYLIAITTALVLLLTTIYLLITPASYTGTTTLLIDPRRVQLFRTDSVTTDLAFDSATVESQVQTLLSEQIVLSVIKSANLHNDPDFIGAGPNFIMQALMNALPFLQDDPISEEQKIRMTVGKFRKALSVSRVGLSYAIQINFEASNPKKAANIANEVAEAYIMDQLESKFQLTQRASVWLQDRIKDLRLQATNAARAVVDFKSDNNIVDAGGKLMNDQQLIEISSQLTASGALTAEARARLDQIKQVNDSKIPDGSITDALKNEVITRMRQQYLDLSRQESEWSSRYGENHTAAVNLRSQMRELERSIRQELKRMEQNYKSDLEIALAREQSLRQNLADLFVVSSNTRQAQVTLRELESSAQSYQTIYDSFLQRYMLAVQQQSFPITDSRVITSATPPQMKSWPKSKFLMMAGLMAGLGLGFGLALAREYLDQVLRTTKQAENATGAECLGILPNVKVSKSKESKKIPLVIQSGSVKNSVNAERILSSKDASLSLVVDDPFSQYSETLRSVKVAADISGLTRDVKILGVVSSLAGEGKTTTTANLGRLISQAGGKVLVIDADLRNPSLTRSLAPDSAAGLIEVLSHKASFADVIWHDNLTNMDFLPSVVPVRVSHTNEIVASDSMKKMLQDLRSHYDYILIDLPPLAPVADVRAAGHLIDNFLMVIEWGVTPIETVQKAIQTSLIGDKLLGCVLNKANLNALKHFESYDSGYYGMPYGKNAA